MVGYAALGIPSSSATVHITAFDTTHLPTYVNAATLLSPVLPGRDNLDPSSYAFLVDHAPSNQKVVFDLGPRKDLQNLSPVNQASLGDIAWHIEKDITELLEEAGTSLDDVTAVVWSHTHFDHIGDMSLFPSSVDLVIGEGTVRDVYPANPNGTLQESDFADRTVKELNFTRSELSFGGFKALDWFEDDSFYLLDVPGHTHGHVAALARVAPSSFLMLAGDSFHHAGHIRPTKALQKTVPISKQLLHSAQTSISTEYFTSGGNDTAGSFDLLARSGPFLQVPEVGFYADPATARTSQVLLQAFDSNQDVLVICAHDVSMAGVIGEMTTTLNEWKQNGVKEQVTWQFVNASDPSFRLGPA